MDNLSCYIRLDNKTAKEAKTPRFEVSAIDGYFKPLEVLKNTKNEIVFYLLDNRSGIKCSQDRRSDSRLQVKGINFSSLYFLGEFGNNIVFFGNPPQKEFLKPKKDKKGNETQVKNPFFENRNDGYLILANKEFTIIEILVFSNRKHIITAEGFKLLAGHFDEALELMRRNAKSYVG